tara:strand:- start:127 stop:477 length:351 start_codon:yes stop_codon:yes gene_type:complete
MARHENEDVSELNIPHQNTKVVFFTSRGKDANENNALAKTVETLNGDDLFSKQFFIKYGRGEIIDPYSIDFGYSQKKLSTMYKYKKVSEQAFVQYEKYLDTKNRLYFTKARRLVME